MPRVVTTVNDFNVFATTCRQFNIYPPRNQSVRLDAEMVAGWVVRLPGLRFPIVCDLLTGLVAYHRCDNAFEPYAKLMRFILRYYDVRARLARSSFTAFQNRHCGLLDAVYRSRTLPIPDHVQAVFFINSTGGSVSRYDCPPRASCPKEE